MRPIKVQMTIPADWVAQAIASQMPVDRHRAMVERCGEAMTRQQAAKEISCSLSTICRLIQSGKLLTACEGMRIDTRSVADYIERRGEHEIAI